jgi:hypothetical protein
MSLPEMHVINEISLAAADDEFCLELNYTIFFYDMYSSLFYDFMSIFINTIRIFLLIVNANDDSLQLILFPIISLTHIQ